MQSRQLPNFKPVRFQLLILLPFISALSQTNRQSIRILLPIKYYWLCVPILLVDELARKEHECQAERSRSQFIQSGFDRQAVLYAQPDKFLEL
ncbi:hypothetical protein [Arundinibacter roseus]|uniref:Uncharacterized protein n=1 Tax=Arundinibacter roseus TaxID=2070510 RepID=A0A4R4KLI1_9BACT|nr:hypothetical protein [Arundinibacter roseus]TDB67451.1 hypothetical protein EZE20_05755 [Arundinibacter roseus]